MKIFSIEIPNLRYKDLLNQITKFENQNIVFTPNPEILLKIKTDKEFENILKQANFLTSDWIGLYIAYQILDNKYWKFINFLLLPYFFFNLFFRRKYLYEKYWDRICWSDLTKNLLVYAENNWTQIVILDLYNPTDEKKVTSQKLFEEKLKNKFPKLKFDYIIFNPEKKEEIFEKIKNSESKIVFSTLWMKKQEENVVETMKNCENIKLWLLYWFSKKSSKSLESYMTRVALQTYNLTKKTRKNQKTLESNFCFYFWGFQRKIEIIILKLSLFLFRILLLLRISFLLFSHQHREQACF